MFVARVWHHDTFAEICQCFALYHTNTRINAHTHTHTPTENVSAVNEQHFWHLFQHYAISYLARMLCYVMHCSKI